MDIASPWPALSIAAMPKPKVMALRAAPCQSNVCGAGGLCGRLRTPNAKAATPIKMTSTKLEHADGLPVPQRRWSILTIALGLTMAVVDGAIANVALPTIAADLNASPAFSIWIVNGYQLAITISLLPLASLGEIIGYRRVYLAGLAWRSCAMVGSATLAMAPSTTAIMRPSAMVRIDQRRCGRGSPSACRAMADGM